MQYIIFFLVVDRQLSLYKLGVVGGSQSTMYQALCVSSLSLPLPFSLKKKAWSRVTTPLVSLMLKKLG